MIGPWLLGAAFAVIAWHFYNQYREGGKVPLIMEFWVFMPGEQAPQQDEAMRMLLARSPAIGRPEGLLLSDIRLHVALVLRTKNPHSFRPDVLSDSLEVTPERLRALSDAQCFMRLRFAHDSATDNPRHVQLLSHLADVYSQLGQGLAVFDRIGDRLYTSQEFAEMLQRSPDATGPENQVRIEWKPGEGGGTACTRGLAKRGLPELVTAPVPSDSQRLMEAVLSEAAAKVWDQKELPANIEVELFGDCFKLEPSGRGAQREVRIFRTQAAS